MRLALIVTILVTICITASAQTESREQVLRQIESKRAEISVLEDKLLAPSDEARSAYAEFLKQPDTGLIRLLPRETYDKDNKLTVRGGGAYYSFALLTHAYGRGSDIALEQNRFSVGFAGYNYGLLVKAGNGPLDELSFEHPFVRPLANYQAAATEPDARSEHQRFGAGVNLNGVSIGNYLPVEVNSIYVLRSLNYPDSDVLVVFKVIDKDQDGSVTILWKLLKRFPKPEVARVNQSPN